MTDDIYIFDKPLKTISNKGMFKYINPIDVPSFIKNSARGSSQKQHILWDDYFQINYGITCNDICSEFGLSQDVLLNEASTLRDEYISHDLYPSTHEFRTTLLDLINGDIFESSDEGPIMYSRVAIEIPLPTSPLDQSSTKEFFRKNLYVPTNYLLPLGLQEIKFDVNVFNFLLHNNHLFDKTMLDKEKSRLIDLVSD